MKWQCPTSNATKTLASNAAGKAFRCSCGQTAKVTAPAPKRRWSTTTENAFAMPSLSKLAELEAVGRVTENASSFKGYSVDPLHEKRRTTEATGLLTTAMAQVEREERDRLKDCQDQNVSQIATRIIGGVAVLIAVFVLNVGGILLAVSMNQFQEDTATYIAEVAEQRRQFQEGGTAGSNTRPTRNSETPPRRPRSNKTVKTVRIGAGEATVTGNPLSHVKIERINGLAIDADGKRKSFNKFGYGIYEPEVNMT